jgi:hypothetical protein
MFWCRPSYCLWKMYFKWNQYYSYEEKKPICILLLGYMKKEYIPRIVCKVRIRQSILWFTDRHLNFQPWSIKRNTFFFFQTDTCTCISFRIFVYFIHLFIFFLQLWFRYVWPFYRYKLIDQKCEISLWRKKIGIGHGCSLLCEYG